MGGTHGHIDECPPVTLGGEAEASLYNDNGFGSALSRLFQYIKTDRESASHIKVYEHAIAALQGSLRNSATDTSIGCKQAIYRAAFEWPMTYSMEFHSLLGYRKPMAMVILAHYGALLHYCRDLWVFGDAGKFIIESIDRAVQEQKDPESAGSSKLLKSLRSSVSLEWPNLLELLGWSPWLEWPKRYLAESSQ